MGLRIRTNMQSLKAQRSLNQNLRDAGSSMEKLSSGYRINKSADDAAGLAISEKMRAGIRSERQAKRNANDGVSFLQVAEGGMNEASNILVRMRELATQASSDTISNVEREFTNREYQQLISEIDRIANTVDFNGIKLLKGTDGNESLDSNLLAIHVGKGNIVEEGANTDVIEIDIEDMQMDSDSLGVLDGRIGPDEPGDSFSRTEAADQLEVIDTALSTVASKRATLGAKQNRMLSTIRNLEVSIENQSAAMSRIKDVDFASETAVSSQAEILANASTSVLSQANKENALALGLLN